MSFSNRYNINDFLETERKYRDSELKLADKYIEIMRKSAEEWKKIAMFWRNAADRIEKDQRKRSPYRIYGATGDRG